MLKRMLPSALLSLALSAPVAADLTYEQEAKMGGFMKVLTLGKGMKTLTQISGDRMRTESDNQVQIVDLAAEKIFELDTKKKTYTVMTFEEMREQMKNAMAQAGAVAQGKAPEGEEGQTAPASTRADIKVDATGRTEQISGYSCKQYLMTVDVTVTNQETKEEGTFSTTTETWLTQDAPGLQEMNAFYRKMAEKLGTTELGRQMASGDSQQSNQFAAGMRGMTEEMKKMDGFPMRSVFYFGPPEAARTEAMKSGQEEEKKGGLGGMFKKALPMGGGSDDADSSPQGPGVLMKMTIETKRIDAKPIDPSAFRVPNGYKQVALEK